MKIVQPTTILEPDLTSSNIPPAEYLVWSSSTVYKTGDRVIVVNSPNAPIVYESLTGGFSVVTLTIAPPCVVSWTGHGFVDGTPIVFTTTGSLPTGIVAGTVYYVKSPSANSFTLAATVGGAAINTSGTQSGVHSATASVNFNKDPTTSPLDSNNNPIWLNAGTTNRWKMFDGSIQSQSSNTQFISVQIEVESYIDTVALLNIDGWFVEVEVTHPQDGQIYYNFVTLTSYLGVTDWYSYFYGDVDKPIDIIFNDIPKRPGVTVFITVYKEPGETVYIGECILGKSKDISSTGLGVEAGARVSIDDYSVKDRDTFGNYTIVERSFNKRADVTVVVETSKVDYVVNLLSKLRATPVLYIGSEKFNSLAIYGFYKNFEVDIAYDSISYCTLQLEGLT